MPEENVEVVKRTFDAFSTGGVEACLPGFSPDAVIYPFAEWPQSTEYRGHDGLRKLLAEWTDNFDDFAFHVHEVREVGDTVLLLWGDHRPNQRLGYADPAAVRGRVLELSRRPDRRGP